MRRKYTEAEIRALFYRILVEEMLKDFELKGVINNEEIQKSLN